MRKLGMVGAVLAGLVFGFSTVAIAAQTPKKVRGTIESIRGDNLIVKSYDGKMVNLVLQSSSKYAWVTPAKLSEVKSGEFIGTAATGPASDLVAQELVIFPNSMRGVGEGHYSWSMPAAVAAADAGHGGGSMNGGPPVQGTMTNGTITSASALSSAPPVQGTMTNGTVTAHTMTSGVKSITISYDNGQKINVNIPAGTPIVRFEPAGKVILSPGAKTFIVASQAGNKLNVDFVAVGKNGLMPPM